MDALVKPPLVAGMQILESKKRLLEEGVFFSNGNATGQVVDEVLGLLDISEYPV